MMPAAASAIAARNTSRGCTSELFRIPRVINRSPRIWLWLPRASTWNSSTTRSRSRVAYTRWTSAGPRIRATGGSVSEPTRRPSSSAAATRAALLRPTPGMRASSARGRLPSRRSEPSTTPSSSPATTSASRPAHPVPRRSAKSSCPVKAAGPTLQSRSRGRSCSGCSARRRGMGEHRWDGRYPGTRITRNAEVGTRNSTTDVGPSVPRSEFRVPRSGRRPVALLELLAAAAGAGIVAADTGIGVAGEGGLRRTACRCPLRGRRRLGRRDQAVRRGFGRDDRRGAAHGVPARRSRHGAGGRPRGGRAARNRDLDRHVAPPVLEPSLREGVLDVAHQPLEHLERFGLVLDQRVFLPPGAVVDALAQLIEVVQVVLPLFVDHAEHEARQRPLPQPDGPRLGAELRLDVLLHQIG